MATRARSPRTDLLRDVLRAAVDVARGLAATDSGAVPAPLRPVVTMQKLTPRALAAADRAGDDHEFRAAVRAAVDLDDLGEADRLWLDRPEGWADALDELVRAREHTAGEDDARKTLARERTARARADAARDEALAELARLRLEAERLRADHDALVARAQDDAERVEAAVAERTRAVRELKGMEARHAQAKEELRQVRAARAVAEARAAEEAEATAAAAAARPSPPAVVDEPPPPDPPDALDRAAAAAAVQAAAGAAAALAASLTDLAGVLGTADGAEAPRPTSGSSRRGPWRTARPAPRRPIGRLPGGLHDDTPEAVAHLVRLPGCALLVDGYNASMATWPGRTLPEQRERLVAALDEMEARVGVETTVVFDGVEERWARSASRRVHVHFTPAGIEADDVILGLVDLIADGRPVVVASDDRRVRDGARRLGAHAIGIDQLRSLVA